MKEIEEFIDKIIGVRLNKWLSVFFALLIGSIIFCLFFDTHIINPSDISWILEGDRLQHYIGSYAFRLDDWHFPITKTTLIAYPEGVSIVYTDSNPLLSIIFKILRPIFPPEYQFFGMWFFLCWILQALFGYLLMFKITKNTLYSLLSAILFCLIPAMFHRIMHTNLIAFWIILWAIYAFLSDDKNQKKKEVLFFVIFIVAALTHGYLSIIAILIGGTWFLKIGIRELKSKSFKAFLFLLLRFCGLFFVYIMVLWVCGFFYNGPTNNTHSEFGHYSMNILSPFDPRNSEFSTFFSPIGFRKTVEGFQYLGVGVIFLYTITTLFIVKRLEIKVSGVFLIMIILIFGALTLLFKEIPLYQMVLFLCSILFSGLIVYSYWKERTKFFLWLFIPALVGLILALSHKVYLGDVRILKYSIPESGLGMRIFQTIRASSRFFWITNIILLIASLLWIYIYSFNKRRAFGVLIICILIQVVDLSRVTLYLNNNEPTKKRIDISEDLKEIISKAKRIDFFAANDYYVSDMHISLLAIAEKIPVNSFYMAHGNGKITEEKLLKNVKDIKEGKMILNDTTLYFINKTSELSFPNNLGLNFYNLHNKLYAFTTSGFDYNNPKLPIISRKEKTLTDILASLPQKEFLVIVGKDDASTKLPTFFSNQLDEAYGTHLSNLQFCESYIAVFQKGKLIHEAVSGGGELIYKEQLNEQNIFCRSVGKGKYKVAASIIINERELSRNTRGLNIVSLNASGTYNTLSFDTYKYEYLK